MILKKLKQINFKQFKVNRFSAAIWSFLTFIRQTFVFMFVAIRVSVCLALCLIVCMVACMAIFMLVLEVVCVSIFQFFKIINGLWIEFVSKLNFIKIDGEIYLLSKIRRMMYRSVFVKNQLQMSICHCNMNHPQMLLGKMRHLIFQCDFEKFRYSPLTIHCPWIASIQEWIYDQTSEKCS